MNKPKFLVWGIFLLQLSIVAFGQGEMPRLAAGSGGVELLVDGKPFVVLGGELGNSSASSVGYLAPFWEKFAAMHLNTLLSPVYWDLMEPAEGRFDFGLVDSLIAGAQEHRLKLILLWFGSWKNSMSCYAPGWIKTQPERFPRARNNAGRNMEILSAFSRENMEADCTAFAGEVPGALMRYLKEKKDSLVPELKECWAGTNFTNKGSWENVFGKGLTTEEIFQAWYYASYANAVARAGKREYALPMYVNAALNHRNVLPGEYPSAGPLPHLMDIWQAAAPAIDILSPDFYNPRFEWYCDLYTRRNNPLLIPEIAASPANAARVFFAVGHYHALGFSPFSIESVVQAAEEPVGKSYGILRQLVPILGKGSGWMGCCWIAANKNKCWSFENGMWRPGRQMNGDQDHQGRHIRIAVGDWGIQRVKLYTY